MCNVDYLSNRLKRGRLVRNLQEAGWLLNKEKYPLKNH